jgi:hypothetical protein
MRPNEAPEDRSHDPAHDEDEHEADDEQLLQVDPRGAPRRCPARRRQRLAFHDGHDSGHARFEPPVEIALLEARDDVLFDDPLRDGIGQHPFEPVSHLDAQCTVLQRND